MNPQPPDRQSGTLPIELRLEQQSFTLSHRMGFCELHNYICGGHHRPIPSQRIRPSFTPVILQPKIKRERGEPLSLSTQHERWRVYSDATHFVSEKDFLSPLSSWTVIPRPLGPVKLLIFTPLTLRSTLRFPFLGYRKETLRSLRL